MSGLVSSTSGSTIHNSSIRKPSETSILNKPKQENQAKWCAQLLPFLQFFCPSYAYLRL